MSVWFVCTTLLVVFSGAAPSRDTVAAVLAAFLRVEPQQVVVEKVALDEGIARVGATVKTGVGGEPILAGLDASTHAVRTITWQKHWRPGRYGKTKVTGQQAAATAHAAVKRWLGKPLQVVRTGPGAGGALFVSLEERVKSGACTGLTATVAVAPDGGRIAVVWITYPARGKIPRPRVGREQAIGVARSLALRKWRGIAKEVQVAKCELVLSTPVVNGGPAWFVEVRAPGLRPAAFIIDAVTGRDMTAAAFR